MQIVHIDANRLRNLHDLTPADAWLQGIALAGVVSTEDPPEQSPLADMQRLYALAWSFVDIEERLERRRYTSQLTWHAPKGWLFGLVGFYLAIFFLALLRDDYGDRLVLFGTLWVVAGVLAAGIIGGLWAYNKRLRYEQAAELQSIKALRESVLATLIEARDALLCRPFAAVADGKLRVHAPHVAWLEACLREVRETEAALRAEMAASKDGIQAAIKAYGQDPELDWTTEGLTADLADLHERCCAAGVARLPPHLHLLSD
jgi:hypothetical protein